MKRQPPNLFARVVCANAPYVIAAALCVAGLLSALVLSAFLPGPWSLAGFAAVFLIAGLPFFGKWSRREVVPEFRLGSREPEPAIRVNVAGGAPFPIHLRMCGNTRISAQAPNKLGGRLLAPVRNLPSARELSTAPCG